MEVTAKRMAPPSINFFSGIFERVLPTIGLRRREEIPRAPIRMPISTSVEPDLERYIGMVGTKMWKTEVNANWAKKQRMNSRDNIFRRVIWGFAAVIPMADTSYKLRVSPGDFISESFSDDLTVDRFLLEWSLSS
jgi:hypothetical protein